MKLATGIVYSSLALLPLAAASKADEKVRNDKVLVTEVVLPPGGKEAFAGNHPTVTVYGKPASFEITESGGKPEKISVTAGESVFAPAESRFIQNTSEAELHYVRTEFLGAGSPDAWGKAGLAPDYTLLFENQYARVYDIRIPARAKEPQHSHHDRVVVCISGATLKHLYPDGHEEPSTLATGQTAWRRGGTHIGQNLGDTDLWVIAIEPK